MLRRKGLKELLKTSYITQTSAKIVRVEYKKRRVETLEAFFSLDIQTMTSLIYPFRSKKKYPHSKQSAMHFSKFSLSEVGLTSNNVS